MAEFQIVLLPRQDYWEWVRACQEYVLAFGPNLTSDPLTAGRYMSPRQVITFPDVPGFSNSVPSCLRCGKSSASSGISSKVNFSVKGRISLKPS